MVAPLGVSSNSDSNEEWTVQRSHRKALVAIAVGALIVGLLVASLALLYPYLEQNYLGPAPEWHSFDSVFGSSGQLVSGSCTLGDLQGVLPGFGGVGKPVATSVMICTFHGARYQGFYGYDCNPGLSGNVEQVNGTEVPSGGCVLSQAPLNHTFIGIFSLGTRTNTSITIFGAGMPVVNLTSTSSWKTWACSLETDNVTKSNGVISCHYQGVPYSSVDVLQSCDVENRIQVNGQSIPPGSCYLVRSDLETNL